MKTYIKLLATIYLSLSIKIYCANNDGKGLEIFNKLAKLNETNLSDTAKGIVMRRVFDNFDNIINNNPNNDIKKIDDVIKYFTNETFVENHEVIVNAIGKDHENEITNEIINNLDIYGDILSEKLDPEKVVQIFNLIKNYDFKNKPAAREMFKTKFIKELLKNLPTNISKELIDFLDSLYKKWMKLPKEVRDILEQYLQNALVNFFKNTGLEKAIDVKKISELVKNSKYFNEVMDFVNELKKMINLTKEKEFVKQNWKQIKPAKILLKTKGEFETIKSMIDTKKLGKGVKKIAKDTIQMCSCKCPRE